MPWNRFVIGYHGCDQSILEDILLGKSEIKRSSNDYDWLGNGVYFWEDSHKRAIQWARESQRIDRPAVVGAIIDLGHCLNLLDVEHLETVKLAFEALNRASEHAETPMPVNRGKTFKDRKLDCAVMETLHRLREDGSLEPYQTVRGFFVEGVPLYDQAGFRHQDHIQLCVRTSRSIVGYFLPRTT
jgi:hypothetical protein